jgi:hypothetical protein
MKEFAEMKGGGHCPSPFVAIYFNFLAFQIDRNFLGWAIVRANSSLDK